MLCKLLTFRKKRTSYGVVSVDYKNCAETWGYVKKHIVEDEDGFIAELRNAWNNRQTIS